MNKNYEIYLNMDMDMEVKRIHKGVHEESECIYLLPPGLEAILARLPIKYTPNSPPISSSNIFLKPKKHRGPLLFPQDPIHITCPTNPFFSSKLLQKHIL